MGAMSRSQGGCAVALSALLLGGCGGAGAAYDLADTAMGAAADEGEAGGGGDEGGDTAGYWWKLSADLPLVGGELQAEGAGLRVLVIDERGAVVCEEALGLSAVEPLEAPDPTIFGWWRLSPTPWGEGCAPQGLPSPLPDAVFVGIGALHAEIEVMLPSVDGLSPLAYPQLNGAYAQLGEGAPVFAFGLAGLEAAYRGEGAAAEAAPLPDGVYALQGIFSFDY